METVKENQRRGIDESSPAEKIIIDWLKKQSYSTKLAAFILSTWQNGDHGTDKIVNEILGEWGTEILDNAHSPSDNLTPEEVVMTGVVAELCVWEENL